MSRLLDFLPPHWSSRSLERRFVSALGLPLDQLLTTVEAISSYYNPRTAPPDWLDYLMSLVGAPTWRGLSDVQKRRLIETAGAIWAAKESIQGAQRYIRALTGEAATVTRLNTTAFVPSVSIVGDPPGPGVNAYAVQVDVPSGSITESDLRKLLEPIWGSYTRIDVVFI